MKTCPLFLFLLLLRAPTPGSIMKSRFILSHQNTLWSTKNLALSSWSKHYLIVPCIERLGYWCDYFKTSADNNCARLPGVHDWIRHNLRQRLWLISELLIGRTSAASGTSMRPAFPLKTFEIFQDWWTFQAWIDVHFSETDIHFRVARLSFISKPSPSPNSSPPSMPDLMD